ncbi:chloride channel protein, partial [Pantoea dispersa]
MHSPDSAQPPRLRHRLRPLISHDKEHIRAVLWGGAVAVALVSIVFAKASDAAFHLFQRIIGHSPWWALLLTPSVFALLAWLTNGALRPTRGSGIPQVIAALEPTFGGINLENLSLRVSAGKLMLTTMALFGGAFAR